MPKKYLIIVCCFLILGCGMVKKETEDTSVVTTSARAENVIIVVIDGTRYQEGFGSMEDAIPTNNTMPNMYALLSQAAILKNLYVGNPSHRTETNPSHATIASGVFSDIQNNGLEVPHAPSLFEYFRKQTGASPTSCYVIMGKSKLGVIAASDAPDYGSAYGATAWAMSTDDATVWSNARTLLAQDHPQLCLINLPLTDGIGHTEFSGDDTPEDDIYNGGSAYEDYLNAIRGADQIVQDLWDFIQNDPTYKNKTTLIVTHDHGRHSNTCNGGGHIQHHDGFSCTETNDGYGIGTCDGVQHLFLFAIGPGIKKGVVSTTKHTLQDIAPTVGRLKGFDLPSANGVVIEDIVE